MPLRLDDLPEDLRRELAGDTRKQRTSKFSQEQVRSYALRAMATLAALDKSERERVLRHALKLNAV